MSRFPIPMDVIEASSNYFESRSWKNPELVNYQTCSLNIIRTNAAENNAEVSLEEISEAYDWRKRKWERSPAWRTTEETSI